MSTPALLVFLNSVLLTFGIAILDIIAQLNPDKPLVYFFWKVL